MPRKARERSNTGIYHTIVRGINRQEIFHEEEDYQKYLATLHRITKECESKLLGYCLMGNHVHLLIHEVDASISAIMKRIGTSYAFWYNWKYERSGHVFQDRFKSEQIENDAYLQTVIRYIHNNPVAAGIVRRPEEYRWSSCKDYYTNNSIFIQTQFILGLFAEEIELATRRFIQYMREDTREKCLEAKEAKRASDDKVRQEITGILSGLSISDLQQLDRKDRDQLLRSIKEIEGSSLRQIARITGLTVYTIHRA